MDGLKYINDNFGHAEGDFAITAIAQMLYKVGKGEAVCARVGGDEFICSFVKQDTNCYTTEEFCEVLESLIRETEGILDKPYPISASVGMVSRKITDNLNLDDMINVADSMMYKQKMERKRG